MLHSARCHFPLTDVDIIDPSPVCRWRESLDEVEEALVTVLALRKRSAIRAVIASVQQTTNIGQRFAVVVGKNGSSTRSTSVHDGSVSIAGRVGLETLLPVVIDRARRSVKRTIRAEPDVAVGVGDPVHDRSLSAELLANGGVTMDSLGTSRVSCNDDLLKVWVQSFVVVVLDHLVEHGVGADTRTVPRVLVSLDQHM